MDGSDDYFSDDIIFDDQALAVLDQQEQKYLTQLTHLPGTTATAAHGLLKRKPYTGNPIRQTPGIQSQFSEETENLPEITLQEDGSYRVQGTSNRPLLLPTTPEKAGLSKNATVGEHIAQKTLVTPAYPSRNFEQRVIPQPSSYNISRRDTPNQYETSIQGKEPLSQSTLGKRPRSSFDLQPYPELKQKLPPVVTTPIQSTSSHDFSYGTHPQSSSGKRARTSANVLKNPMSANILPLPPMALSEDDIPHPLAKKIEELQEKLKEMSQMNTKIQAALLAAEDEKIAKAGEVSVLRRAMEKTAQDHAAYVANLKAAKDQADAKQVQMQKSMREEIERIKTQFIFKQHELEASHRKPPPSVRASKTLRIPPSTPTLQPSQIRGWNQSIPNVAQSLFVEDIPRYLATQENTKTFFRAPHTSPERNKRPNALPGFQNAFVTSTPLRPSQQRVNVGKQRELQGSQIRDGPFPNIFHIPASPPSSPIQNLRPQFTNYLSNAMDEPTIVLPPDTDKDIVMTVDDEEAILMEEEDEMDLVEKPDWKIELNRVILTETLSPFTTPSFQTIIEAVTIIDLPIDMGQIYPAACSAILETIGTAFNHDDFEKALDDISHSLCTMIPILNKLKLCLPLAALLNLLKALCNSLPKFGFSLLSHSCGKNENPSILIYLSDIIHDHIESSEMFTHKETLSKEVVSLLEALCFHTKDELIHRLTFMPQAHTSLLALLHNYQPSWLLVRGVRILVLLATHTPLCHAFMSIVDPNLHVVGPFANPRRSAIIERLCYHLTETNRKDPECHELKTLILSFFALLSHSNPEIHSALVGSAILIPTIIVFLSQLTTPIWDDNEELIAASPDAVTLAIRTLNQALFLLHHLIFSATPIYNLKQKLSSVNGIRHFNGLTHIFVVTFGRLCYADTPGWVNQQGSQELVLLTDMAREILDLVVDGPECDNIWQAYHFESDSGSQIDEEEMEADLLGRQ